jgi:hypothetical protein
MLKNFSTKQIVFSALMGALMFILSFALGSGLNVAIGNPAASGLVSCLIQAIMMTTAILISRRFGVVTLMWLVYGVLAIPTNMLGGLPGLLKVCLALGIGIIFDVVVYFLNYKKWSLFFAFVLMYVFLVPVNLWIYFALGLPNANVLLKSAPYLFAIFLIESFIGIWIGLKIYNRVKSKSFVRQLS